MNAEASGRWLGQHALAAFGATLALTLLIVALLWLMARHQRVVRLVGRMPTLTWLAPPLLIGFAIVIGTGALFAELTEAMDATDSIARFDEALTAEVASTVSSATLQAFAIVTRLGNAMTVTALGIVVAAVLLLRKRYLLAIAWIAAVAGNGAITRLLKDLFERARPVHTHALIVETSYSFPSGHASGSIVAYGMLTYLLLGSVPLRWRLPLLLAAVALTATIAVSRVFLQVHYASDVAAGLTSGTLWLAVCIASVEFAGFRSRRPASLRADQ
ncbi:phosphatase PAP2 family protein [soil metagenome]